MSNVKSIQDLLKEQVIGIAPSPGTLEERKLSDWDKMWMDAVSSQKPKTPEEQVQEEYEAMFYVPERELLESGEMTVKQILMSRKLLGVLKGNRPSNDNINGFDAKDLFAQFPQYSLTDMMK